MHDIAPPRGWDVGRLSRAPALIALLLCLSSVPASAQQDEIARQVQALPWQRAPAVGHLGSTAEIALDGRLQYLDAPATSRFLELNGNPPLDGAFAVAPRNLHWFAIFAFDPVGHVQDGGSLDQDAMLRMLDARNRAGTAERRARHLPVLTVQGWSAPPRYDAIGHRLEWGLRLRDPEDRAIINYTVSLLGRSGVMSATLVSDPISFPADIREFQETLEGFTYAPGESYGEFREGGPVAEAGLGALAPGRAAALTGPAGLFKGFGQFLGLAVCGAGAASLLAFQAKVARTFRRR
jgi:uncharacterized membrane-anchored protein